MRYCSLLLTGLFASASVVVTTQVKAQKPVQVQKRSSMNPVLFTKIANAANTALYNCYTNKLVHECARLNRIQNILIKYCARGDKMTCKLWAVLDRSEIAAQFEQNLLGPDPWDFQP
ncbi:MAG: hypothetical protein WBA07_06050 [Rivularia sp. (in: cyanobacteria)]